MRPPRILFVSAEVPGVGGSSTAGYSLFARMQREGHDVHFLSVVEPAAAGWQANAFGPDLGNPLRLPGVSVCLPRGPLTSASPELAAAMEAAAPDLVLGLGFLAAAWAGRSAPGLRLTYLTGSCRQAREYLRIGWARDMISLGAKLARRRVPPPILNAIEAEAVDRSLMVLTHSPQTQAMMQWFFPSQLRKIHPRVFSMAEWISEGAEAFRGIARPFEARDIDLLFVAADWGRHEKNYRWVEAIARRLRTARVHIIGQVPWPLRGATHHGFLAGREELFTLMARARCVVSPSVSDAAPGVLFEAAALGCNVVASRNCGNWDLCHEALLAEPFAVDSFVACAARAMQRKYDDNLAAFLARHCYDDLVETLLAFGSPFGATPCRMSDVAAVFLSVGEAFAGRARASLERQVPPLSQVVEVLNVTPFHRALNQGARQVTTPFFVQVDADMILDPDCVATLRAAAGGDVGIVVGELRDELMGRVVGVKLFRTECFRGGGLPDTISPDTDFGAQLARAGWRTVYVGRPAEGTGDPVHTLGEHRPEYTPAYTFRKHLVEGRRYWHRGAPQGMRWRLDALAQSAHPLAVFSQLALAHGLFLPESADGLTPVADDPRAAWLEAMLRAGRGADAAPPVPTIAPPRPLRAVFREAFALGRALSADQDGAGLHATVRSLGASGGHPHALVARIGLGHGVLSQAPTGPGDAEEDLLRRFILLGLGGRSTPLQVARARVGLMLDRLSGRRHLARW